MTKIEAIAAMRNEEKVTHTYFSDNEWMQLLSTGDYEFEDGCVVDPALFWSDRKGLDWEDGWEIFSN